MVPERNCIRTIDVIGVPFASPKEPELHILDALRDCKR